MQKKNLNISVLLSVLTFFSLAPSAYSNSLNPESLKEMTLEELLDVNIVYAASKKEQKVSQAPANTIIVSEEEIKNRGYFHLKDVLADLPGMETIEYHFSEVGTLVPVRGVSGNNKIIVLVNGMKINPPARENMMFRNDQSVRYAKRIEIVYGPGSALYGTDAVSAVINIVTKTNEDYKAEEKRGMASLRGGLNSTVEGSFGGSYEVNENSSIDGFIQYFRSSGTDYPTAYPEYFKGYLDVFNKAAPGESAYQRWDEGLNSLINLRTGDTTFQYLHRSSDRSSSQGILASFPYSAQAHWKDSSNIFRAENNLRFADNLLATTSVTYNRYEIDPSTAYVWILNDKYNYNDDKYGRGRGIEFEERLLWDVLKESEALGDFSKNLSLTGGVWLADYESVPKATVAGGYKPDENLVSQGEDFIYYNSREDRGTSGNAQSVSPIIALSYQNYAGYLQADWQIWDRLSAVLGGRIDKDSRFNIVPFTPRASLIYSPLDNLTMKLIYGQAFVFPPPYFTHAVYQNPIQINEPNSNMKPEQAQSRELNVSYTLGNFSVNTSAYYNTQSDLFLLGDGAPEQTIVKNEIWVEGSDTPIKLTHNTNSGQSQMYGVDSLFNFRFTKDHNLFLALSFVNGEFNVLGKTSGLDRVSNFNTRLGGTFNVFDRLHISPRLSWRSTPNFTDEQAPHLKAELSTPAYQIDIYSYYDLDSFRIFLDLNNITNNKYALHGGYAPIPAEAFNGTIGVDYRF